jgi:hypothetical protein
LLHELFSLVNVGRILLSRYMPLSQLLCQSYSKKLKSTQNWIYLFQPAIESIIGIAFKLPSHFDLGGELLYILLLDGSFIEVYVLVPHPADFALGGASLSAGTIKRGRSCDIQFFPLASQQLLVGYHLILSRCIHHLERMTTECGLFKMAHGDGFGLWERWGGEDVGGYEGIASGSGDYGRIGVTHAYLHCVCQDLVNGHLFPASLLLHPWALIGGGNSALPSRSPLTGFLQRVEADLDSKDIHALHPQLGGRGK